MKPPLTHHGVEALEVLRRDEWDLVISDVDMPEMDGFELTEQRARRSAPARHARDHRHIARLRGIPAAWHRGGRRCVRDEGLLSITGSCSKRFGG